MKVTIESKHSDLSDDLRKLVYSKVEKLSHYFKHIVSAEVYMHDKNGKFEIEIKLNVPEDTLFVREAGLSYEAALDIAVDVMKTTLTRYKGRTLHQDMNEPTDNV
jgi:putative sigma-54 modulation protein